MRILFFLFMSGTQLALYDFSPLVNSHQFQMSSFSQKSFLLKEELFKRHNQESRNVTKERFLKKTFYLFLLISGSTAVATIFQKYKSKLLGLKDSSEQFFAEYCSTASDSVFWEMISERCWASSDQDSLKAVLQHPCKKYVSSLVTEKEVLVVIKVAPNQSAQELEGIHDHQAHFMIPLVLWPRLVTEIMYFSRESTLVKVLDMTHTTPSEYWKYYLKKMKNQGENRASNSFFSTFNIFFDGAPAMGSHIFFGGVKPLSPEEETVWANLYFSSHENQIPLLQFPSISQQIVPQRQKSVPMENRFKSIASVFALGFMIKKSMENPLETLKNLTAIFANLAYLFDVVFERFLKEHLKSLWFFSRSFLWFPMNYTKNAYSFFKKQNCRSSSIIDMETAYLQRKYLYGLGKDWQNSLENFMENYHKAKRGGATVDPLSWSFVKMALRLPIEQFSFEKSSFVIPKDMELYAPRLQEELKEFINYSIMKNSKKNVVYFKGNSGVGKTKAAHLVSELLQWRLIVAFWDKATPKDILGENEGSPGLLFEAVSRGNHEYFPKENNLILFLDEFDDLVNGRSDVTSLMLKLLDSDTLCIYLPYFGAEVRLPPLIILAGNENLQSRSLRDRIVEINFPDFTKQQKRNFIYKILLPSLGISFSGKNRVHELVLRKKIEKILREDSSPGLRALKRRGEMLANEYLEKISSKD